MTEIQERAARFQALFTAGGINTRRVKVLGGFVHIDTFHKYAETIGHVMGGAGFRLLFAEDGRHMDGVDGFRMVFRLV